MPKMKRQEVQEEQEEGAPAWMATFGDLMSLLLTFFVLLLSFSAIQDDDFRKAMASFRRAVSILKYSPATDVVPIQLEPSIDGEEMLNQKATAQILGNIPDYSTMMAIAKSIDSQIKEMNMGGVLQVYASSKDIRLVIPSLVLFERGQAELTAKSRKLLVG